MRVLILSQYFWPEAFRINEVAESLQKTGCEVCVLTGQPNYPEGKVLTGYRALATGREDHAGCTIFRVPLVPRGQGSACRLMVNYLSFVLGAGLLGPWLLRGRRFDAIFVYGISPILQAVPGVVLRRFTGGALVVWVQDLWPQSLEVTGFVRKPWLLSIVAAVVRWIYRQSDLLLVQSRGFVPLVSAMAGKTPVEYHPNPGEMAFREDLQGPPVLWLEPGFNVVFAGNLGTVQALDTVLDAAVILRALPDVRFVLIGSGSRGDWVGQEVHRRGLCNVQLTGRLPPQAMPKIFSQASVLLVTLVRSPSMSHTVPSKIQAYLAAGRPIVAALDGEGARVVEDAGAGVTCPAEDAVALAEAVRRLRRCSKDELGQMGNGGRSYYEKHFEPNMLARRLADRFARLVVERNGRGSASG